MNKFEVLRPDGTLLFYEYFGENISLPTTFKIFGDGCLNVGKNHVIKPPWVITMTPVENPLPVGSTVKRAGGSIHD